jgi:hypothetical protein
MFNKQAFEAGLVKKVHALLHLYLSPNLQMFEIRFWSQFFAHYATLCCPLQIFDKLKKPIEMVTIWATACLSNFFTFSTK